MASGRWATPRSCSRICAAPRRRAAGAVPGPFASRARLRRGLGDLDVVLAGGPAQARQRLAQAGLAVLGVADGEVERAGVVEGERLQAQARSPIRGSMAVTTSRFFEGCARQAVEGVGCVGVEAQREGLDDAVVFAGAEVATSGGAAEEWFRRGRGRPRGRKAAALRNASASGGVRRRARGPRGSRLSVQAPRRGGPTWRARELPTSSRAAMTYGERRTTVPMGRARPGCGRRGWRCCGTRRGQQGRSRPSSACRATSASALRSTSTAEASAARARSRQAALRQRRLPRRSS